ATDLSGHNGGIVERVEDFHIVGPAQSRRANSDKLVAAASQSPRTRRIVTGSPWSPAWSMLLVRAMFPDPIPLPVRTWSRESILLDPLIIFSASSKPVRC